MKRLLASLLCLFLVLAATACGAATPPQGPGTTPLPSSSTTPSATSAEPASSPAPTAEPAATPTAEPSPSPAQLDLKAMENRFLKEYPDTDMTSKPYFTMINAKDGVSFYIGPDVVKLYEYESETVMDKAIKDFGLTETKGFTRRGLLLLETDNKKALDIFKR